MKALLFVALLLVLSIHTGAVDIQEGAFFNKYDKDSDGNLDLEEYKKLLKDQWHGLSDPDAPAHMPPWSEKDREEIYKMQDHYMAEDWNKDGLISFAEFERSSSRLVGLVGAYRWPGEVEMVAEANELEDIIDEIDETDGTREEDSLDIDLEEGIVGMDEFDTDEDTQEEEASQSCKSNLRQEEPQVDEHQIRAKVETAWFDKYDKDSDGNLDLEEYKKLLKDEWHGASDIDAPAHMPPWSVEDREEIYKMQEHYMAEDWNKDALISRSEFESISIQLASTGELGHRWPATVKMVSRDAANTETVDGEEDARGDEDKPAADDVDDEHDVDIDLEDGIVQDDEFADADADDTRQPPPAAPSPAAGGAWFDTYDKDGDGNLDLEEYKKLLKDEWHGASDIDAPAHMPPWSVEDREEIYKMQEHYMAEDWNKDALISRSEFDAASRQLAKQKTPYRRALIEQ